MPFTDIPVLISNIELGTATINDDGSMTIEISPSDQGIVVLDGFQRGGSTGFYLNPRPAPPTMPAFMAPEKDQES